MISRVVITWRTKQPVQQAVPYLPMLATKALLLLFSDMTKGTGMGSCSGLSQASIRV